MKITAFFILFIAITFNSYGQENNTNNSVPQPELSSKNNISEKKHNGKEKPTNEPEEAILSSPIKILEGIENKEKPELKKLKEEREKLRKKNRKVLIYFKFRFRLFFFVFFFPLFNLTLQCILFLFLLCWI